MAKNEIQDAILKDGKLYCPSCENLLGNIKDYFPIEVDGEKLVQFVRYCSFQKCHTESQYQLKLTLDERKVFVYPKEKCKKLKFKKEEIKEESI